jgi:tight adherence protein C
VTFLFFRLVMPVLSFAVCAFYIFVMPPTELSVTMEAGVILFATYIGLKAPELYLSNKISKRQFSMGRAFPDALDLLLICVESACRSNTPFARSRRKSASSPYRLPRS